MTASRRGEIRLEFAAVAKKFRRGAWSRSLRDAMAALARRALGRGDPEELGDQEFHSLHEVSFRVHAGECVGIIGPNGAGKSTILKLAAGILRPNLGRVRVRGRICPLIEVGAGFHPDLTGRENVFLNGVILGMRRREIAKRFERIVEFAGIEEFLDTPVKRYSSGMYSRLGFAVAAFMDPEVLLLDEVFAVGDQAFGYKCQKRIREILAGAAAVLFVSHQLAAVRSICDHVLVLDRGRLIFQGKPDDAIHHYQELWRQVDQQGARHPALRRLAVRLGDESGAETRHVLPGAPVTLSLSLTAGRRLREAGLGFFIRDEQDTPIYASSTDALGIVPVELQAGATLHARFRLTANLLPGSYWIGTQVFGRPEPDGPEGRRTLDEVLNRLPLIITGRSEAMGSANLFTQIDVGVELACDLSPATARR